MVPNMGITNNNFLSNADTSHDPLEKITNTKINLYEKRQKQTLNLILHFDLSQKIKLAN